MIHRTLSIFLLHGSLRGLLCGLWLFGASCGPRVSVPGVAAEPAPAPAPAPARGEESALGPSVAASEAAPEPAHEAAASAAAAASEIEVPPPEQDGARLSALAVALSDAQVSELAASRFEQPCDELEGAAALVRVRQGGAEQLCALGNRPGLCAAVRGKPAKQRQALCAAVRTGAATPFAAKLEAALTPLVEAGWQARTRSARGEAPVIELRDDEGTVHALVGGASWRLVAEPVALVESGGGGVDRLWPATELGHGATYVSVATSSMGGSESGEQTTWLFVLCEQEQALRVCARKIIGRLVWSLGPGERARLSRGARSLTGRPHLEVSLRPELMGSALRLGQAVSTLPSRLRERFSLPAEECSGGAKLCGPWHDLTALRAEVGAWAFDGAQLVRAK